MKTAEIEELFCRRLGTCVVSVFTSGGGGVMATDNTNVFREELRELINRRSMEGVFGDTPDFVLADYVMSCLNAFVSAQVSRTACNRNASCCGGLHAVREAAEKSEFAAIESTFDCKIGNMELRVWRKARDVSRAAEHIFDDVQQVVADVAANPTFSRVELAQRVAQLHGIAAVQMREVRNHFNGDFGRGFVIYVDWP